MFIFGICANYRHGVGSGHVVDVRRGTGVQLRRRQMSDAHVEAPVDDREVEHATAMAKFNLSLYGVRAGAQGCHNEFTPAMLEAWSVKGRISPCTFYRKSRRASSTVHGDDFADAFHNGVSVQSVIGRTSRLYTLPSCWRRSRFEPRQSSQHIIAFDSAKVPS